MTKQFTSHSFKSICNNKHYFITGNRRKFLSIAMIFVMIFSFLSPQASFAQSTILHDSTIMTVPVPLKGISTYIQKVMKQRHIPGLAIAVVKDGKVAFMKGYGVRKLGKPAKVNTNTLFTIGSMTKQFTAAALGTLVSAGKLSWNAPAAKYLKDFRLKSPYVTQHITLRDLLSHRSGYCDPTWMWYAAYDTKGNIIHRLRYQEPRYGFRSHFCYNNVMFLTGAWFIPAVTGETWNTYLSEHLFKPLDMTWTSTTEEAIDTASDAATPHAEINGKVEVIDRYWIHDMDVMAPIGGINSCVKDLSHWIEMMLADGQYDGQTVLRPDIIRAMETPQSIVENNTFVGRWMRTQTPKSHFFAYGLGLMIQNYGRYKVVWHGGNIDGMTSAMALVPSQHLGVIVLTNLDECWAAEGIVFHVLQSYLGLPNYDVSKNMYAIRQTIAKEHNTEEKKLEGTCKKSAKGPLPDSAYVGTYRDEFYGIAQVHQENGHLVLSLGNPDFTGKLIPCHDNTFVITWHDHFYGKNYVTFYFDQYGKANKISFAQLPMQFGRADPVAK